MSAWKQDHHLKISLAKSEVLVVPAKQSIHHSDIKMCLSLSRLSNHVSSVSQWCCLGKIRPFLTQHAVQLPLQSMTFSHIHYYNALLTVVPLCAVLLL